MSIGPKKLIYRKKVEPYKLEDGITQSMLATFLECRQRSRFSLDSWESIMGGGWSALRGDLYHFLLETWYAPGAETFQTRPEVWMFQAIDTWKKKKLAKLVEVKAIEEAENFAIAVFPEYVKRWSRSDAKFQWESLEEVFDIKYLGYRLRGKFDGVLTMNGKRWLFETKTKAQIDEDGIIEGLSFNFQNLFYLTALAAMKRPAIGVIYNIVRYPQLRPRKTESTEQFQARVGMDIIERKNWYFYRYEVNYTPKVLDGFNKELQFKLADFAAWSRGELPTYKNETACLGKMKCSYLGACSSGSMAGYRQERVLFRELQPE